MQVAGQLVVLIPENFHLLLKTFDGLLQKIVFFSELASLLDVLLVLYFVVLQDLYPDGIIV
jgi:hypothetical protein